MVALAQLCSVEIQASNDQSRTHTLPTRGSRLGACSNLSFQLHRGWPSSLGRLSPEALSRTGQGDFPASGSSADVPRGYPPHIRTNTRGRGNTILKDYVREYRRRRREMFVPLTHPPGRAQANFGEPWAVINAVVWMLGNAVEHTGTHVRASTHLSLAVSIRA